jgi:hypothetical protein
MQVGSGIFSSPGVVVAEVGSVGASLVIWVVSGLLAWTGARWVRVRVLLQLKWNQPDESYSSFAELGCAIPLSGGAQAYLAYAVRLFTPRFLVRCSPQLISTSLDQCPRISTLGRLYPHSNLVARPSSR